MPKVKLKVNRWLCQGSEGDSIDFVEIPVLTRESESIAAMVRRLAAENSVFREAIFDEENQEIQASIIVILNGRIVNPYDRSEATLKEGDEVMFLSMVDGG